MNAHSSVFKNVSVSDEHSRLKIVDNILNFKRFYTQCS